jgi:hypothetical protein
MQVDLIFWGAGWNSGGGPGLRANVQNSVNAILNSPYFDGLSQYRGIGHGSLLRSDTITSSSPGTTFTDGDARTFVGDNINNNVLPGPNGRLLYVVVPQPGSTETGCGCDGDHAAGVASGNRIYPYAVTTNNTGIALDRLTVILSHEMAEAATNPELNISINGRNQAAFHVPGDVTDEIGDGEPALNNYVYRVNGMLVQAYLSQRDHAYIVTNGQTQNLFVSSSRVLTVNGDQRANHDDNITLDVSGGGVRVTLNGEVAQFEPGAITDIEVRSGNGNDTINVLRTLSGMPVNINSTGPARVIVGNNGNLDGIQSLEITISNPNGSTGVVIDDHNRGGPRRATFNTIITDAQYTQLTDLLPAGGEIYVQRSNRPVDVYTGIGVVDVFVRATTGHSLNLHGNSPNTAVFVGNNGSLDGIQTGGITIDNQNGSTGVVIDDRNRGGPRRATFDTIMSDGLFTRLADLLPGGGEIYVQRSNRPVDVYTGIGVVDVFVRATTGHSLNLHGNSPNTAVFVGNNGSLDGIQALGMTIDNQNGSTGVVIDDRNRGGTRTATFDTITTSDQFVQLTDLIPGDIYLQCTTTRNLDVYTGTGAVTANVRATCDQGVAPTLNAGSGTNTLDYTGYAGNVLVNFQTGEFTGFSSIANIQNVIGGQGANILVGDGNESLTGGTGQNLIISGGGTSQLVGGGAGDILIGGTTAYDTDDASLQAILNYWTTSGDDYPTRVANLRAGNGVPQLEAGLTVFDNGAANTLTGNGNEAQGLFNLFYVTEAGTVTDPQPDEVVVDIDNPAGAPPSANHGGPRNRSQETLPLAVAADRYFLQSRDEMNGTNLFRRAVQGEQVPATARIHPAVQAASVSLDWTNFTLDFFAQLQLER